MRHAHWPCGSDVGILQELAPTPGWRCFPQDTGRRRMLPCVAVAQAMAGVASWEARCRVRNGPPRASPRSSSSASSARRTRRLSSRTPRAPAVTSAVTHALRMRRSACDASLAVTRAEYEAVRDYGSRFLVEPQSREPRERMGAERERALRRHRRRGRRRSLPRPGAATPGTPGSKLETGERDDGPSPARPDRKRAGGPHRARHEARGRARPRGHRRLDERRRGRSADVGRAPRCRTRRPRHELDRTRSS